MKSLVRLYIKGVQGFFYFLIQLEKYLCGKLLTLSACLAISRIIEGVFMGAYRHITVQIPYWMYVRLKTRSVKREIPYASIVRKLLEGYLDSKTEKPTMTGGA